MTAGVDAAAPAGATLGIAFALTLAAGVATGIGGLLALLPQALTSRKILSGALGLAAGVMIHVSYVEVFPQCDANFAEHFGLALEEATKADHAKKIAAIAGSFFSGMLAVALLDYMINRVLKAPEADVVAALDEAERRAHDHAHGHELAVEGEPQERERAGASVHPAPKLSTDKGETARADNLNSKGETAKGELAPTVNAAPRFQAAGDADAAAEAGACPASRPPPGSFRARSAAAIDVDLQIAPRSATSPGAALSSETLVQEERTVPADADGERKASRPVPEAAASGLHLLSVAIVTWLAIALHKVPEGIASFLSLATDLKVGGAVALAIAVHNIPEGISVGITVLQATGSRRKAVLWSFLSGAAEPLGAAIGWGIVGRGMTPAASGIVFGLVAGVMVFTSFVELLPTAFRIRAGDKYTAGAIILGAFIMQMSFILFEI